MTKHSTRGSRGAGCCRSFSLFVRVAKPLDGIWRSCCVCWGIAALSLAVGGGLDSVARALDITGYSATVNDRFSSGFPTAPIANTDASFIGLPYDWSGVGWSATDGTKGFGFISPQHYLVARHYGGASTIRFVSPDGTLRSVSQDSVTATNYGVIFQGQTVGDLSVGTLVNPAPASWQMARYAVLDANSSSTTNNSYNTAPLLVYGRGPNGSSSPRIGSAVVNGTFLGGLESAVTTNYADVQLQTGDSGSPIFIPWTNPNGAAELTILGNNAGTDFATQNAFNYFANSTLMGVINGIVNADGFALRVTGAPSASWQGGGAGPTADDLSRGSNWSGASVPTDLYTSFDADTASILTPEVNGPTNLRGLFFLSTGSSGDGFTFAGANALTIGRGGVVNYDSDRQSFSAPITLGDSQYWDAGAGGVTAGAITTGGNLLEVAGTGTTLFSGDVAGSGGVALSGTRLEMTGTSSYTGGTWVHSGTLAVDGSIAASSGVTVNAGGVLAGAGTVAGISGSGSVGPGNSPGILTATSVDPSVGLDFSVEFTQTGSPVWGTATASGNDVLRLTDGSSPFASALTSSNVIDVYLDVASLTLGDTFRGGFFTDQSADFLTNIEDATFTYFLASGTGSVSYNGVAYDPYAGPLSFDWTTVAETATFSGGSQSGFVSQFVAVPEPGAFGLLGSGMGVVCVIWQRRRLHVLGRWQDVDRSVQ
jgi:autotransporter-associated beta strand protein